MLKKRDAIHQRQLKSSNESKRKTRQDFKQIHQQVSRLQVKQGQLY
jgi:predicted transcriptional regulator